ncbi:HSP20-like chaperone [Aspergillus avenaceus]|uniref:HSP20-like chaperone n=1 Tax=Aspergillus avenaceus TaxID=36643 RepID=A0A5N6TD89_ASPAV|nr:HSP20-like chaperone [Aspergillus avenaceus]
MAFLPQLPGNYAPLFHLLDDYDIHRSCRPKQKAADVRVFTPRFDVYEKKQSYYLHGELPGVNQNQIEIAFTDPHTLVIKGYGERDYDNNTYNRNEQTATPTDASPNKCLQPTVEDDNEENDTLSVNSRVEPSKKAATQEPSNSRFKYWATERSVGEFHRTFNFPMRVDQEAVKASLKNGVLSVIAPKEPAPTLKKIRVE